jgi:NAD(P)-dependent dehydrogenase (short-subunit alcohol dehydrogenase family)
MPRLKVKQADMSFEQSFQGGVAVVTGAGSGLGEAIARQAAAIGMQVVVAEHAAERGERVAAEIRAQGGDALFVHCDVTRRDSVLELARRTQAHYGPVRLLVNNAGISVIGSVWEVPGADWDRAVGTNLMGVLHGIQAFVPGMLKAGTPAWVANVASLASVCIAPDSAPYFVTKHAVLSLTESLHVDLQMRQAPINVSVVAPGLVSTRIFDDALATGHREGEQRDFMRGLVSQLGMSAADAAQRVLEGVASGAFWVTTHPGPLDFLARERAEYLCTRGAPQPSDQQAGLGAER